MRTIRWRRSRSEKLRAAVARWKRCGLYMVAVAIAFGGCSSAPAGGGVRRVLTQEAQMSGTDARLIAVSAVSEKVVWVSGARGTWLRTTDGGTNWRGGRVPGADTLQFRDVEGVDSNTAYLLSIGPGDQSRIYKTTDAGAHWSRIPPAQLPPALEGEGSFAASGTCVTTRPGGLAWFVSNNKDHARILKTTDFGRHWSVTTLPVTTRDGVGAQSVAFRDDQHGIVLSGGYASQARDTGAAITADDGATWTVVTRPPLTSGVWGGAYVRAEKSPLIVAVGPSGAVWSEDSGRRWAVIDSLNYWSVGFSPEGAGWAVGEKGRITRLAVARHP